MRVLLVSDLYKPVIGGTERYVESLGRELAARGHDVAVATLRHSGLPAYEREGDVAIHRLGGWTNALAPFYRDAAQRFHPTVPDPGFARRLDRLVSAFRPEIVHCNGWSVYSALRVAPRHRAKVVLSLHDFSLVCAKKTFVRAGGVCSGPGFGRCVRCAGDAYGRPKGAALATGLQLSSVMHRRVDAFIAASEVVSRAAAGAVPPEKISVIPSFATPTGRTDTTGRRPAFLRGVDEYILFVGALGPHKGVDVLLRAYRHLGRDVPLVLLGTPRKDWAGSYPANAVVAHDVPHDDVLAAWRHAAIGVVPSTVPEGFGLAAVEASAAGVPVVASRLGALPEIVADGKTGLLVSPGDADELAAALRRLLDDPALRSRLGSAARRRSDRFAPAAATGRIERLYRSLLEAA